MAKFFYRGIFILVGLIVASAGIRKDGEDIEEYLDNLSRSLAYRLSNPGKETETLVRDLFDYNNHLEELHENITEGKSHIRTEGLNLVQEMIENGGPRHLKVEVDFDAFLFKVYKNDKDVQTVHNVLKDSKSEWEKLKGLYEKHAQI